MFIPKNVNEREKKVTEELLKTLQCEEADFIEIKNEKIHNLGNLKEAYSIRIQDNSVIKEIGKNLKIIHQCLYLISVNLQSLETLESVKCINSTGQELWNLHNDLKIEELFISDPMSLALKKQPRCYKNFFGNLRLLQNLFFAHHQISEINSIDTVIQDCVFYNCPNLKSLGSIEYIMGNLNLSKTNVLDFGNLKYVGGSIIVSGENIKLKNMIEKKFPENKIYESKKILAI